MSQVDIIRGEIPTAPESFLRRLREYDPRLRVSFCRRRGLWKVEEQLRNSGAWSFVCYWADGAYPDYQFKPLPFSPEPLFARIAHCDLQRRGTDLAKYALELDSQGAVARAAAMRKAQVQMNERFQRYMKWCMDRAHIVQRRFEKGGRSRTQAIKERLGVLRDLGLLRSE